jgi:hypothetical protein
MSDETFIPEEFAVPGGLIAELFRLDPLGPQHNEADYAAWTGSLDHIRATPGFPDGNRPHEVLAWVERDWPFDSITYAPRT